MNFLEEITKAFLPELVLTIFILLNIVLSIFASKRTYKISRWFAILGIVFTLCATLQVQEAAYAFNNSFLSNSLSMFFKTLVLITGFFIVFLSGSVVRSRRDRAFEYFTLVLTAILGAMCLISSNDFLTMFISLETLGICCYILTAYTKNYQAKEAGLKYLITGCVATAIMLFGVSYIYGFTGLLNFEAINAFYLANFPTIVFTFALMLVMFGLLFKIGAIPFHNWVPDIYEGANYPTAAFLSTIPKLAGFAILLKIMFLLGSLSPIMQFVSITIATVSIIYGNIGAIKQTNIKRFLGYSSVAHAGYVLLAFCVLYYYNAAAILFYLFCYIFMNIGAFAAVILFNNSTSKNNIEDYKGLAYQRPFYVIAFSLCLFSLAGFPVTSGFLSKIYLFAAVVRSGFLFHAYLVIALIASVVGVYAYLNIIKVMFERTKDVAQLDNRFTSIKFILYFCAIITFLLCIFASPIINLCIELGYSLM